MSFTCRVPGGSVAGTEKFWTEEGAEGEAKKDPQARRGHSRDHRRDCVQVCIGLEHGFDTIDEINDLCISGVSSQTVAQAGLDYCDGRGDCGYVVDCPEVLCRAGRTERPCRGFT